MFEHLTAAAVRIDSWFNALTKVGLDYNKTAFSFVRAGRIDDTTLEGLYNEDPFAARICDAFPEEATRQGFTLKLGCAEHETATMARLDALGAVEKLKEAWTWARVFGGAVVFVGADDGLPADLPLNEGQIRSVRFLTVLDRRDLQPQSWYTDPLNPRFGSPETYTFTVSGGGGGTDSRTVHQSRLIRFDGAPVTRRERLRNNWWGGSELNRTFTALQQFNGAYASSATLLQEASQGVLSIKNLYRLLAQDKDDTLKKRFEAMDMARSIGRSVLIDADGEKYERIESSAFSGLPDTVDRFMFLLAGASRIPVTILMGQAPAGLNATGDSDIRTFYDRVRAAQLTALKPRLLRLVRLFLLAQDGLTRGQLPPTLDVEFNPLYQMTPKEQAELRKLVADTDGVNIDKGIVTAEEVALNRFRPGGWSMETVIDLDARRAAQAADASSAAEGDGGADGDQTERIAAIVAKVAGRELPRASGVALLVSSLGMLPEDAESVMGETGRSFFTKPDPAATTELDSLREQHAALRKSHQGTRQMLTRVLEKNKRGELVIGSPIARAPTATEEGDTLEEGDVVAVPTEPKTDSLDETGAPPVAIVLPLGSLSEEAYAMLGPTALRAADLHLTLAYLGRRVLTDDEANALVRALNRWAEGLAPIPALLNGVGRFSGEGDDGDPVYLSVDAPRVTMERPSLLAVLRDAGFRPVMTHGFVPHVTITYVAPSEPTPLVRVKPIEVRFTSVALWAGSRRVEVPLRSDYDTPEPAFRDPPSIAQDGGVR